jgi:hypothetical protein
LFSSGIQTATPKNVQKAVFNITVTAVGTANLKNVTTLHVTEIKQLWWSNQQKEWSSVSSNITTQTCTAKLSHDISQNHISMKEMTGNVTTLLNHTLTIEYIISLTSI